MARRAPRSIREYLEGPPKVSQQKLADRVGCHQSMISQLASGVRHPRGPLALRLHEETGVPLQILLEGPKKKKVDTHANPDDADDDPGSAHLVHRQVES